MRSAYLAGCMGALLGILGTLPSPAGSPMCSSSLPVLSPGGSSLCSIPSSFSSLRVALPVQHLLSFSWSSGNPLRRVIALSPRSSGRLLCRVITFSPRFAETSAQSVIHSSKVRRRLLRRVLFPSIRSSGTSAQRGGGGRGVIPLIRSSGDRCRRVLLLP